ncbi:MAG: GNAT family N-acetyltransferase [Thermonemataceae bacterium]
MLTKQYLFSAERLGFRNWHTEDLAAFAALNADQEVMKYFPTTRTESETSALMERLQQHYKTWGFTYFAVEVLATEAFIGFIGLTHIAYEAPFTPTIDIGWRLKKSAWGKGYATEGAKKCLSLAFEKWKLDRVVATCTIQNTPSKKVMKKIGMTRKGVFDHPKLKEYPAYQSCIWYEIENE